jgi:hypothetical protein
MLSIGPLAHVFVPLLSRSIDAVPAEQAATS